jgi:hypothetical protein
LSSLDCRDRSHGRSLCSEPTSGVPRARRPITGLNIAPLVKAKLAPAQAFLA